MTIKTGVDIAVVAEDLATPTLQRVGAGIERLESTAESVGGKVSDRLGEGLIGGLSAALAGTALDAALEHAVESAKAGEVGFELGVSIANLALVADACPTDGLARLVDAVRTRLTVTVSKKLARSPSRRSRAPR